MESAGLEWTAMTEIVKMTRSEIAVAMMSILRWPEGERAVALGGAGDRTSTVILSNLGPLQE
jgi:hypothetical protein